LTIDRINYLITLHPSRRRDVPSPPSLASAISAVLTGDELKKLIRRCDQGKSAGPSGLTAGHLAGLAQDPQCLAGLVAMIQDIADGNLSPEATDIITGAVSVATDKSDGDTSSNQVRPLAVPEILYKLAAMFIISSMQQHMAILFPTIQLGCGIKNGVESALHRTQVALEAGGDGSDTVVLSLDFRNAFNERQRSTIAKALYDAPLTSRIWRFFLLCYGDRPSHLGLYDRGMLVHRFINDDGVRQGCPVASFLYALSVQHIYEAAVAGIPGLEAVAIADDFTITGPSLSVARALQQLVIACRTDGPNLNFAKCKALWAYSTNHPNYQSFCEAMRSYSEPIPISYDAIPLLGAAVGLGMTRASHCERAVEKHQHFFEAITHPDMSVQAAMLLLRVSGIPRLTYLTRVIPPTVIRAACEAFDARIMQLVADKCHLPDPATNTAVRRQITQPYRCGGMAFSPHTRSSPAAYYASMAASAYNITNHRSETEMKNRLRDTDTAFHLADTHSLLLATGVDPTLRANKERLPKEMDDFWTFFAGSSKIRPQLQRHLTTLMTNKMYLSDPTPLPFIEAIAAAAAADEESDDIRSQPITPTTTELLFTTYPTSSFTNIADHEYRLALRHRLHLPVVDHLPTLCHPKPSNAGKPCMVELAKHPDHFHSCHLRRKKGNYNRHEKLVTCLYQLARRAGIFADKEKAIRDASNKRTVPDLKFSNTHIGTVHTDVTVCGSYSKSNQKAGAMKGRAAEKTKQHYPGAAAECATFIPFVIDSLGRFGPGAWRIIDLIVGADLAQSRTGDQHSTPELTRMNIARAIAIQLQAGNAAIDLDGMAAQGTPLHPPPSHHSHYLPHPSAPQQHQRPRVPLPATIHDTLRRPPASPAAIPSVIRATAAAAAAATAAASGESKREGKGPPDNNNNTNNMTTSSSTSSSSTSSSSSSSSASGSSSSSSSSSPLIFLQSTLVHADFTGDLVDPNYHQPSSSSSLSSSPPTPHQQLAPSFSTTSSSSSSNATQRDHDRPG
jgi:hypothetical protein